MWKSVLKPALLKLVWRLSLQVVMLYLSSLPVREPSQTVKWLKCSRPHHVNGTIIGSSAWKLKSKALKLSLWRNCIWDLSCPAIHESVVDVISDQKYLCGQQVWLQTVNWDRECPIRVPQRFMFCRGRDRVDTLYESVDFNRHLEWKVAVPLCYSLSRDMWHVYSGPSLQCPVLPAWWLIYTIL